MDLICLSRISLSLENKKNNSYNFIGFVTNNRKIITPHHEINLNSLDLCDLKTTYALTRDRTEQKKIYLRIKSLENLVIEHKIKW